jgi:hypothetical protein
LRRAINVMIERTYAKAPVRTRGYHLVQPERINPRDRERLLEKAFWMHFGFVQDVVQLPDAGACHIQTYQMPLQHSRADTAWGKVDLIGVSEDTTPVVFELKREGAADTPLRMIVEGLAYAIAIRRAWNEGRLREEWVRDVQVQDPPQTLLTVPIVGIAPIEFWQRRTTNGQRDFVPLRAGTLLRQLCDDLALRGFPVSFVQFNATDKDPNGLPIITDVSQPQLPW